MRVRGKLTSWNGDRGIGYITPSVGAKQLLVRYTEFTNKHNPPEVGQFVAFELSTDVVGRPVASKVAREGEVLRTERRRRERRKSFIKTAVAVIIVVAVSVALFKFQQADAVDSQAAKTTSSSTASIP